MNTVLASFTRIAWKIILSFQTAVKKNAEKLIQVSEKPAAKISVPAYELEAHQKEGN